MSSPSVEATSVPGLLLVRIPVHEDARGSFKESWQREKMVALGLPDFQPVQSNVSVSRKGATRGFHAEPWDKLVTVVQGRAFAAWVDLREGPTFGTTFHCELRPDAAVFVPRGVANAYQALDEITTYTYLVNDHWRPDVSYPAVDLADPDVAVPWPIPLAEAELSDKDRANPGLASVTPVPPGRTLLIGALGQLGCALHAAFPAAHAVDIDQLDLTDPQQVDAWPWADYDVVLNASGYTAVDAAETPDGRRTAWQVNAVAPALLAEQARRHRFALVHYSTDYVFDGTRSIHREEDPLSPLGVYAQSKAASEVAIGSAGRHYLIRTSWLVGEGHNFVRTMAGMASRGEYASVVCDQVGRLTFADELARATRHLLDVGAPYGTYQCTNGGPPTSWAEIAALVFELCGRSASDVTPITTRQYAEGRSVAPRPASSMLALDKLEATGFVPEDAQRALRRYLGHPDAPGR